MSSKQVFEEMRSSEWQKVRAILSTNTFTPADLEEKHGVHSIFSPKRQQINVTI